MLNSLHIKNYRNLEDLEIPSLGRINLITGRNNTGKSTLLEAVAIYASQGDLFQVYQFLEERGEYQPASTRIAGDKVVESKTRALTSLFTGRKFETDLSISIAGGFDDSILRIRFIRFFEEYIVDDQGNAIGKKRITVNEINDPFGEEIKVGFEIRLGENVYFHPIEQDGFRSARYLKQETKQKFQFIRPRNIDREINGKLWDSITLTEKEQFVIDALRIIEPATERIAFIGENPGERRAVIKLANAPSVLPLLSMGDGINRILTIILALVNSEGGYLLIDEFENGLHYSVQEKLWEIVFHLAQKLNVQVFATTHSEDCIFGFEEVLNRQGNPDQGILIRLERKNGQIRQVDYTASELKIAAEQDIETR